MYTHHEVVPIVADPLLPALKQFRSAVLHKRKEEKEYVGANSNNDSSSSLPFEVSTTNEQETRSAHHEFFSIVAVPSSPAPWQLASPVLQERKEEKE